MKTSGLLLEPATVISKKRGDAPEVHYLIGPQRESREEAETDLARWKKSIPIGDQGFQSGLDEAGNHDPRCPVALAVKIREGA